MSRRDWFGYLWISLAVFLCFTTRLALHLTLVTAEERDEPPKPAPFWHRP